MSPQVEHTDVGAYALGLLDDGDRLAFEEHLRGCAACQGELDEMSGTAGILSAFGATAERAAEPSPAPGASAPAPVIDMMRRRRKADRRSRRVATAIGTAAAAAALAAGIGVGTALDDGGTSPNPAPTQAITGQKFTGKNPATGATGTVGLVDKGWGTQVNFQLGGIRGPLRCQLEAVSKDGTRSVVAGWRVPNEGYGVPEQPKPLVMQGGTALGRQQISHFEVRLDTGGTLLTIPV
ncbi:anti-sigma factor family protein [Actinomadura syzygii]|uniref:Putative zinc-finger domain-containing protein n=1 Tax=Actinomadura syzygii TaxID=1427538 RepID=A0A5D0U649_9ACTN|nr:zf-HC2 domain-containing protein [Actinomadura syzygii]TYC13878.1 hypothetical protein FXF65_19715 [Actinomadura syzygii]